MIKFKRISIALLATICISSSIFSQKAIPAQVEFKPSSEVVDATSNALSYMLPKTSIVVEIEMEKVIKKAGPYYRYSQRFLNLSQVILEDSEEWLIKNVHISTNGKADESKRYSVFTKGKTSANQLSLTSDGILAGVNCFKNSALSYPAAKENNSPVISLDDIHFDNVSLNEELLYKTSTAAMAQEAANMVYRLRTNRTELLSGELENLPPDGEAYKTVLEEITKQEKEFVSLFAGKTVRVKQTKVFEITPDPLSSYANVVLCRFNQQKGLVDPMDITGTPIYLKMDLAPFSKLENKRTEEPKHPQRKGLFYTIPANATVNIVDKNTPIGSQQIKLAQYGQVVSLPAAILEKENVVIHICPVTGALMGIGEK